MTYENDILVIPEKFKELTLAEIEREKARMLEEILSSERSKKPKRKNEKGITFNF